MKKKHVVRWLSSGAITLCMSSTTLYGEGLSTTLDLEESPVNHSQLQAARGMADIEMVMMSNGADQNAMLQDNKLYSDATGNNIINQGAFTGTAGITSLIQNTGNQVVIQETTLVNIMFRQ